MRVSARNAVRALSVLIPVSVAVACGGNPSPSSGSGPVGALGIPGDSLHKLAANAALWPVRDSADRKCEGSFVCWLPFGRKVLVDIYADTGARNRAANPTASGPTLVGKFENRGRSSERRYNLTNGPYDFLLFVYPATGGSEGRWVIERVDKAPTGGSYDHETVSEGRYVGCGHDTVTWSKSFGDFRTCAMGPPNPPPPGVTRLGYHPPVGVNTAGFAALSFFKKIYMLATASGDPAWFTCQAGCCVADLM